VPSGAKSVQIQVTTRHGHTSDATQERVVAKSEKLLRFFERLTTVEVVIDLEDKALPRVEILVSAEHKHDFVAHEQAAELMAAVDGAVQKMEQQLRKYKEKVQERHRNSDARRLPASETEPN
jgi:putative sigma-54 modulation protein